MSWNFNPSVFFLHFNFIYHTTVYRDIFDLRIFSENDYRKVY